MSDRLAALALIVATAGPAAADSAGDWYAAPREGYGFIGVALGAAGSTFDNDEALCPGCTVEQGAFDGAFWLGYMVRPHIGLMIDGSVAGQVVDDPAQRFDTFGERTGTLAVRYWLSRRTWAQLGAGGGNVAYVDGDGVETAAVSGFVGRARFGVEVLTWTEAAVHVIGQAGVIAGDGEEVWTGGVAVGLDWWFYNFAK